MPPKLAVVSKTLESSKNYDADVHSLKGKVSDVIHALPEYDQFKLFVVDTLDGEKYANRITALTRQKIKIQQATNAIDELYDDVTTSYEQLIQIYRDEPAESRLKTQMDKLEDEKKVTSLIRALKSMKVILKNIIVEIAEHIELITNLHRPSAESYSQGSENIRVRTEDTVSVSNVEALKVPKFDGENYVEFIAGFDDLIHSNPMYSKNAKAQYFKAAIIGRAAKCINGIPATGENYQLMYDKVRSKFSRVSLNQHSILRKLENLQPACNNSHSLEEKLDEIEEILNHLNTADIGIEDSTNPMWQRLILRKFPVELAGKIVTENHNNMHFTVRDLLNEIEDEAFGLRFKEDAGFGDIKNEHRETHTAYNSNYQRNNLQVERSRNEYSVPVNPMKGDFTTSSCIFCPSADHSSENCRIPIQEKKDFLNQNRLCWKCYKKGHAGFQCEMPNCSCGGLHNPSMCRYAKEQRVHDELGSNKIPHQYSENQQNQYQPTRASYQVHNAIIESSENQNGVTQHIEEQELQTYHTVVNKDKDLPSNPILMTCSGSSYSPAINRFVETSFFFDAGSNCTLVSEKFANDMKLKILSEKEYSLKGINDKSERIKGYEVEITLKDKVGNEKLVTALTTPKISDAMITSKLNEFELTYVKANNISISNAYIKGELICPDILIGADSYHQLTLNEPTEMLPSGLHIVKTVFGSAIFGIRRLIKDREGINSNIRKERKSEKGKGSIGNRNPKVKEHNVRANTIQREDKNSSNLKTKRYMQVTLSSEVLSLLRRRTSAQLYKNRKRRKQYLNVINLNPFSSSINTGLQGGISVVHQTSCSREDNSILKKSDNQSKIEQTSEVDDRPIHISAVQLNENVKAAKNSKRNEGVLVQ